MLALILLNIIFSPPYVGSRQFDGFAQLTDFVPNGVRLRPLQHFVFVSHTSLRSSLWHKQYQYLAAAVILLVALAYSELSGQECFTSDKEGRTRVRKISRTGPSGTRIPPSTPLN